MNRIVLYFLVLVGTLGLFSSCSQGSDGELTGVQERPSWGGESPYGMVYVPSGTLVIGQSEQDMFNTYLQKQRSISIQGFWMDETEITNNEYRQFVNYVKDSIAHITLGNTYPNDRGDEIIDWEIPLDYYSEELDFMFYGGNEAFAGERELDTRKLVYEYQWKDWNEAAHNREAIRTSILNKEKVSVYPDTLCWIRDYSYSYNEPMTRNYFWHPAFDDYPLVGVTWKQAKAFSFWRTQYWNGARIDEPNTETFRLPTESEWEYAARGGLESSPYPWGAYYLRNAKGCLLANFKPGRGNYPEDGGMYTVPVDSYFPNGYGLYCMSGNVSEWTESAYQDNANYMVHDMNPDIKYDAQADDPEAWKRKVIRGGSWKDVGHFLQNGTRAWEYQDTSKSYIGFRNVRTFLGRSINDFK